VRLTGVAGTLAGHLGRRFHEARHSRRYSLYCRSSQPPVHGSLSSNNKFGGAQWRATNKMWRRPGAWQGWPIWPGAVFRTCRIVSVVEPIRHGPIRRLASQARLLAYLLLCANLLFVQQTRRDAAAALAGGARSSSSSLEHGLASPSFRSAPQASPSLSPSASSSWSGLSLILLLHSLSLSVVSVASRCNHPQAGHHIPRQARPLLVPAVKSSSIAWSWSRS
jgi:hypothetical protein